MDQFDKAQQLDALYLEHAINAVLTVPEGGPGQVVCIDCGEEIPEKRRSAVPGCTRCLDCQQLYEQER
ncbi:MAG: TraR/DksA family transcriptional regulator [Kiritimatiellia bacterium]